MYNTMVKADRGQGTEEEEALRVRLKNLKI